ncbi:MAG: ribosome silencing factor [Chloroflexi bacterium]|nr:MAG: ribosome silencing factor [Chloroflexota bacterium]
MEAVELAKKIVEAALNKQAFDILLLDLRGRCSFADYFVLCSGESERQIQAICDEIDRVIAQEGLSLNRREGKTDSGWVLLDLGNVIVHVFAPQQREFYRLEKVWERASTVLKIL